MLLVKSLGAKMSKAVLHKVMRGARRWQLRRGTELDPTGFNGKAGVPVRMTASMATRSPIRGKRRLVGPTISRDRVKACFQTKRSGELAVRVITPPGRDVDPAREGGRKLL
ncbi:hypothetical protein X736_20445 [Mesorhizobium sp. L2C089B000]|nr:hypothetical protein X736_20445 [Mesorhizobium sp. L2C089B000]ESZ76434.1 hypothetical protein X726_11655 [Mesorhizobium sp. L103C105A0]